MRRMRLPTKTVPKPKQIEATPEGKSETTEAPPSPLTPQELADRLTPTDPRIAPDGKMVAFVVSPMGKKGEHAERAIWFSRNGEAAIQFSSGVANDHSPRWSPDGKKLLFLSDRAERGTDKIFIMPLDGGEAKAVGDLSGELSVPEWSPDGTKIAVLRTDPEPEAEKKRKEEKVDHVVVDAFPQLARLWIVNVEDGSARSITAGKRQIRSFGWDPSGDRLAITTTDGP